ncbi:hypothetical protein, partial [Staphylococcus pseudintermedius]|uniref:hypothetical protein n=1 Tax=Staphylococcus pseudintermedius TaxID=283734 RepID=UPI000D9E4891
IWNIESKTNNCKKILSINIKWLKKLLYIDTSKLIFNHQLKFEDVSSKFLGVYAIHLYESSAIFFLNAK